MKILYLHLDREIPVQGDLETSTRIRGFVRAAAGLGHEVVLACACRGGDSAAPPARIIEFAPDESPPIDDARAAQPAATLSDDEAAILRRELGRVSYDREVDARVLKRLAAQRFRPDLVYERHALFHRAGVVIARHYACPRVLEVDAPLVDERRGSSGLYLEQTARMIETASLRGADRIVTTSEEIRWQLRAAGIDEDRIHVMHPGVDVGRYGLAGDGEEMRAELGFRRDDCVIGFVAGPPGVRDAAFLVDVFREIAAQRRGARLLAVGDGVGAEQLRRLTERSGCADRVTLVGAAPPAQVPAWISATDVVVTPCGDAREPPLSAVAAIEALASGKPVVAPRLGRFVEVVDHGRTGLLYAAGDASSCRDAVLDLIDDPARRRAMGREARLHAVDHDWRQVVRRVIEIAAWPDASSVRAGS